MIDHDPLWVRCFWMRLDAEDASGFPTLPASAPIDRPLVLVRRVTRADCIAGSAPEWQDAANDWPF